MSHLGQKNGHKSHKSDGVTAPLIPMGENVVFVVFLAVRTQNVNKLQIDTV